MRRVRGTHGVYAVDDQPLSMQEEALFKGFLNATINGLLSAGYDAPVSWPVPSEPGAKENAYASVAFGYAEAMLRRYRQRMVPIQEPTR